MIQAYLAPLATLLAVCYPLLAHLSIERRSLPLAVGAIGALALSALLPGLARGRAAAWIAAPLAALACWALARTGLPEIALYAPPVLVPAFMAWVFGRTLSPGRSPLIAQVIEHLHARDERPPPPDVWPYARRLTSAWTGLFTFIAAVNLLLALLAEPRGLLLVSGVQPWWRVPQEWWSWFANVIGYALVALFFAIEYAWRRVRFPEQPYRNVFDFFRRLAGVMPQLVARNR